MRPREPVVRLAPCCSRQHATGRPSSPGPGAPHPRPPRLSRHGVQAATACWTACSSTPACRTASRVASRASLSELTTVLTVTVAGNRVYGTMWVFTQLCAVAPSKTPRLGRRHHDRAATVPAAVLNLVMHDHMRTPDDQARFRAYNPAASSQPCWPQRGASRLDTGQSGPGSAYRPRLGQGNGAETELAVRITIRVFVHSRFVLREPFPRACGDAGLGELRLRKGPGQDLRPAQLPGSRCQQQLAGPPPRGAAGAPGVLQLRGRVQQGVPLWCGYRAVGSRVEVGSASGTG